jgi:gas vesicle protein
MSDDRNAGGIILAFIAGAILGAGVALVLAPATGQETREKIKDAARRTREKLDEAASAIRDRVS